MVPLELQDEHRMAYAHIRALALSLNHARSVSSRGKVAYPPHRTERDGCYEVHRSDRALYRRSFVHVVSCA